MKSKHLILSHPTGNANVRALAEGFLEHELLHRFYTCIAMFEESTLYPLTAYGRLKEFRKRTFSNELKPFTRSRNTKEIIRLLAERTGQVRLTSHEKGPFCIDKVYQDLDSYVSGRISRANAVYAYEDGALQSFRKAKMLGIHCFYDLPIGHWRAMRKYLNEERMRNPEWAETLNNFKDSSAKLSRKDEELRLADQIFVASSFTARTLDQFPGQLSPVQVIPYGFPNVNDKRTYEEKIKAPIKILYVGSLSQRKGISYLFGAIDKFREKVELTLVGKRTTDACKILNKNLKAHKWIPSMNHHDLLKLMSEQDLLVFPSLFEGFGLVITEAMSQGTPVITTERTCGPDLIKNGENGWLIDAGSQEALEAQLEQILTRPELLIKVGKAARETARQRPWKSYSNQLSNTILNILEKEGVWN